MVFINKIISTFENLIFRKKLNMKAFVFPGQGAQFSGMGKELYEKSEKARNLFEKANEILGFDIKEIMFNGSDEDLKKTEVTQPAIFLHSIAALETIEDLHPTAVAGHSLGEFSALVASKTISFEAALLLVSKRAKAMQTACEKTDSTMAAILGLEDHIVEETCKEINGIVVPANYNCPGQLVISGEIAPVNEACDRLKEKGAKRALVLPVSGAFHSPLMQPAEEQLAKAIDKVDFNEPICPIYQNFTSRGTTNPEVIKQNLINQLTGPVLWTQTIQNMIEDGIDEFIEIGPGRTLQGLIKKINRNTNVSGIN